MFGNYLKVALRNLLRHKVYSAINILGLAIGTAACIIILLWVLFNLSFDSFHANADRICWLYEHQSFAGTEPRYVSTTMPPMGPALQEDLPEIEGFCRLLLPRYEFVVRCEEKLYGIEEALYADSALFRIFSFPLLAGDPATALQQPNSLVVSQELALRLFGEKDPLGQVVIHERESYTVTGVLKKLPRNSHLRFEALISFSSLENRQPWGKNREWSTNCLFTYLLLRPEANPEEVERKLPGFLQKHLGESADNYKLLLMPVKEIRFHSPTGFGKGSDNKLQLFLFAGLALTVLLLACINFINLSTARSNLRAREVGLRKALGASRPMVARQFLTESVLLAALALLVAIALVELALPRLNSRLGTGLEFHYLSDWQLSLFLVATTLAVGLLAGSYPAAVISSFQPSAVLRGDATSGPGRRWLRRALVFAQFVVSLLLITCTLVVYGQWKFMRSKDLGLNASQVICLPENSEMRDRYEAFRHSLVGNQAIESVTAAAYPFWLKTWNAGFRYEGDSFKSIDEAWRVEFIEVDYDFIEFFGLELVAGRGFSRNRPTDQQAYVINETLARKIGWSPQQAL
ncbi:MAG: ABC transporter permease, partial [Candidatus Glassbacteria bacterium]